MSTAPSSSSPQPWRRTDWLIVGMLLAIVAVAFGSVVRCEFVNFDDEVYVTNNPRLRGGLSWDSLLWSFTTFHFANWHPLVWCSYLLDYQLYGLDAAGFHQTNLLWHAANSLVLFAALRRLTGAVWPSALAAALFAVHPLNVQSVAWVSERKGLISGFFWMLCLWAYAVYAERQRWRDLALVAGSLALGLMAKQMLVTLPCVLLLLDFWPLRRFGNVPLARLLVEKLPLLILVAAAAGLGVLAQQRSGAIVSWDASPLSVRVANAVVSYAAYLGQFIVPVNLAAHYAFPKEIPLSQVAAAALVLGGLTILAVMRGRQQPYLLVGWLWFLGTLVPVIGVVQIGSQARADRYVYIPGIGLFLAGSWFVAEQAGRLQLGRAAAAAAGAVLVVYALISSAQLSHWHDSRRLWQHVLDVTEGNPVAHDCMGTLLLPEDQAAALKLFREAVRLDPNYGKAHYNLGVALLRRGELLEAITQLQAALRSDPRDAQAHINLGIALAQRGDLSLASYHLHEAVRLEPDDVRARRNLAALLIRQGAPAAAVEQLRHAVAVEPDSPALLDTLAAAQAEAGDYAAAAGTARTAVARAWAAQQPALADEIEARRKLYEQGRPR